MPLCLHEHADALECGPRSTSPMRPTSWEAQTGAWEGDDAHPWARSVHSVCLRTISLCRGGLETRIRGCVSTRRQLASTGPCSLPRPVLLHSSQPGAQVGTNLKPAMKIRPRDELSHLLILGLSSQACRCDMIQSTKNRDLSRHLTFRLPPSPLASLSPFLFYLPLGMDASAAMTTNQQIDQRHVLHFFWRPPVTAQKNSFQSDAARRLSFVSLGDVSRNCRCLPSVGSGGDNYVKTTSAR